MMIISFSQKKKTKLSKLTNRQKKTEKENSLKRFVPNSGIIATQMVGKTFDESRI